jgi:hypothetical protein
MCAKSGLLTEGPTTKRRELHWRFPRERGAGRFKAILWTFVLLLLVFVAYKLVPVYVAKYELQDKMTATARFATVNRRSDDQIRDEIFKEVQDLDIPAHREDIHVENSTSLVRISLEYAVPVDFLIFQTELHFDLAAENHSLT